MPCVYLPGPAPAVTVANTQCPEKNHDGKLCSFQIYRNTRPGHTMFFQALRIGLSMSFNVKHQMVDTNILKLPGIFFLQ